MSSSPPGIFALAVPGLFFKLKVSSELACASLHFISTAARKRKVGNYLRYFRNTVNFDKMFGQLVTKLQ